MASECEDVGQSEKWRRQIIGEVSRKVAQIQNGKSGETLCGSTENTRLTKLSISVGV